MLFCNEGRWGSRRLEDKRNEQCAQRVQLGLIKEHCGTYLVNFRKAVDKCLSFSFWTKVMVVLTLILIYNCRSNVDMGVVMGETI